MMSLCCCLLFFSFKKMSKAASTVDACSPYFILDFRSKATGLDIIGISQKVKGTCRYIRRSEFYSIFVNRKRSSEESLPTSL